MIQIQKTNLLLFLREVCESDNLHKGTHGLLDVTTIVATVSCSILSSIIGVASEYLATRTCILDSI